MTANQYTIRAKDRRDIVGSALPVIGMQSRARHVPRWSDGSNVSCLRREVVTDECPTVGLETDAGFCHPQWGVLK
jgi:hypothetical protein